MNDIRCKLASPWQPESYKNPIGDACLLDCYDNCQAKFPKMYKKTIGDACLLDCYGYCEAKFPKV
jgi:hypothetical protein